MSARTYIYPVNDLHSTILGYSTRTETGSRLWSELSWPGAWKDSGTHFLNPDGGDYLHVHTRPLADKCSYRVRCAHCIGSRWRGGVVKDVAVIRRNGAWQWHVEVAKPVRRAGKEQA